METLLLHLIRMSDWNNFLSKRNDIQKLLDKEGTHTMSDIYKSLANASMQLWTKGETVVLTEILDYPVAKIINVVIAVGDLEEVQELIPQIEQFGLLNNCNKIQMIGRKGWARVFPDAEVTNIVLRRTICQDLAVEEKRPKPKPQQQQ